MSYCSETLKEIFLELPLPAGGMVAVVVGGMREGAVGRLGRQRGGAPVRAAGLRLFGGGQLTEETRERDGDVEAGEVELRV